MQSPAVALLVARPGRIREAWRALLLSTCCIGTVHVTGDAPGLLKALEAQPPDLVLLDADALGSETPLLVETIRARQPACRCILLVRGEREAREATGLGATEVLVKGLPAGHLFEAVERVLAWPNSTTDELEPA